MSDGNGTAPDCSPDFGFQCGGQGGDLATLLGGLVVAALLVGAVVLVVRLLRRYDD